MNFGTVDAGWSFAIGADWYRAAEYDELKYGLHCDCRSKAYNGVHGAVSTTRQRLQIANWQL